MSGTNSSLVRILGLASEVHALFPFCPNCKSKDLNMMDDPKHLFTGNYKIVYCRKCHTQLGYYWLPRKDENGANTN